jgi:hypothetical protein
MNANTAAAGAHVAGGGLDLKPFVLRAGVVFHADLRRCSIWPTLSGTGTSSANSSSYLDELSPHAGQKNQCVFRPAADIRKRMISTTISTVETLASQMAKSQAIRFHSGDRFADA